MREAFAWWASCRSIAVHVRLGCSFVDERNQPRDGITMRDEKSTIQHATREVMTLAPSIAARDLTRSFIKQDAPEYGGSESAQRALARRLGVAPGTVRNLAGGRLKRICADVFARLKAEQMRRINLDLQRASHELSIARACGVDPRSPEFRALQAAAEAARKVMEEG